ncbi:MAG: hypothetical protein O2815_04285 [Actinomycetota bacterium]|nr:hypothetical protein [Actinomycetota bacterium]
MPTSNDDASPRVIVLPDASWVDRDEVVVAIKRTGLGVLDIATPMESKAVCAAIISAQVHPPLIVVARGDGCHVLPAVALSLRTQHRDTAGYVLVDPDAPPSTDTWPEAPVTVVSTTQEDGKSLRGWPIVSAAGDVAGSVALVVTQIAHG